MGGRETFSLICLLLTTAATDASAMELDDLLPTNIPGYAVPKGLSVLDRVHPETAPEPVQLGAVTLDPALQVVSGYDSAPAGVAGGSSLFELDPSLVAFDPLLGLGAYASGAIARYPGAPAQSTSGYTVALGEHALLPRETINLAISALGVEETNFGLGTLDITKPVGVAVKDVRVNDAVIFGMLTLKPELSATFYRFSGYAAQNRVDYRQGLTGEFTAGGPARLVAYLHATESLYPDPAFSATTYSALAGIADQATGLWNIRLLAGLSARDAEAGGDVTAPVLEASIEWMPTELDSLKLDLAREIDDPEQETAAGYTRSQVDVSIAHEYLRNVLLTGSFDYSHAAFFDSPLVESLYGVNAGLAWHLNRRFTVNAGYAFNDRQANLLQAANQHIFTLGVTWSP